MEEAQAGGNTLGLFPDLRGVTRNGRASVGEIRATGRGDSEVVWVAARVGARGLSASRRNYIFLNAIAVQLLEHHSFLISSLSP